MITERLPEILGKHVTMLYLIEYDQNPKLL